MSIRKIKCPNPPPSPGPPMKYRDPGSRRYRLEVIQVVHIDIDVTAGPHPNDQDEQVVRRIATDILDEYRRNPNGWQARFERCFPEVVDKPSVSLGEVTDVGPGTQMSPNQRQVLNELQKAGAEVTFSDDVDYTEIVDVAGRVVRRIALPPPADVIEVDSVQVEPQEAGNDETDSNQGIGESSPDDS